MAEDWKPDASVLSGFKRSRTGTYVGLTMEIR
jgi:hypothetical protein